MGSNKNGWLDFWRVKLSTFPFKNVSSENRAQLNYKVKCGVITLPPQNRLPGPLLEASPSPL